MTVPKIDYITLIFKYSNFYCKNAHLYVCALIMTKLYINYCLVLKYSINLNQKC